MRRSRAGPWQTGATSFLQVLPVGRRLAFVLSVARQNLNLPQLRESIFGLGSLLCHGLPPFT